MPPQVSFSLHCVTYWQPHRTAPRLLSNQSTERVCSSFSLLPLLALSLIAKQGEKNLCVGLTKLQPNIPVHPAAENLLLKFNTTGNRVELQSSSSRTNQFQCCFTSKETIRFTRDGEPRTASIRLLSSEPIKPGYGCFSQYPGTLTNAV